MFLVVLINARMNVIILVVSFYAALYRVYTCRFNNQIPNRKLVKNTLLLSSSHNILFVMRIQQARNLGFKTLKAVFTNVRFRS